MTEQITRNRLAVNANARIRDRCNSGISWGTNNYPAYSNPGWFAGTTGGLGHTLSAGSFSAGNPSASQAKAVFRYFANLFGGIKWVRILIYRSHYSLGSELIYDGQAIANTIYGSADYGSAAPLASLRDDVEMNLDVLNANLDELWNYYVAYCRSGNTMNLQNTICHTSCHVNCHCSRGRR
ncbi:hypothetical protein D3C78_388860 [compost metagenome]